MTGSYIPPDASARLTSALARAGTGSVHDWRGVHHTPPPFTGHPQGVVDDVELPDLVDVQEAPPSPAEVLAAHGARLDVLEAQAHVHEPPEPAYSDQVALPDNPLTEDEWNG